MTVNDEMVRVYEGTEADEAQKVALGKMESSGGIEWTDFVRLPSGLSVGDYVSYYPNGTYTWQAKYASSDLADDGSADVILASGTEVTSENQDMTLTNWRVFSIDEITGEVELVSTAPTTGTVRLHGAQGYNNGVKLLNDACNSLYGDVKKGIVGRSININDIESRMTPEALAEAHSYSNGSTEWGEQVQSAYTYNKQYPLIYAKENLSVINGIKNTAGLGMSEQTTLIERHDDGATLGKLVATTSIQPYQTYWTKDNTFMKTAFVGEGTGSSNTNYNLIIPKNESTYYWLSSRCVSAPENNGGFVVLRIDTGILKNGNMCYASGAGFNDLRGLFPIISLNVNIVTGNDTDGWKVK